MEQVLTGIALAAPAGLNAYIPLLAVALAERFGWLQLSQPFDVLGEWWMIAIIAVLLAVEVVADKVPAVDHVNDGIQTIVRPAAGGILAVAAGGSATVHPGLLVAAGVIMAGGVHAAKAAARPVVNVTTGGAGAPVASTVEDGVSLGMTVLAIAVPVLAILVVIAFFALAVWAVVRLRRRRTTG